MLLFSGAAGCQTAREYLIAAQTSGTIQFRDQETLNVISGLHVELPANSTGINGVLADPHDGQTLYIEGPEQELQDENGTSGCCWLYSINLQTLETKVAAGIWGTTSRRRFVDAGASLMTAVSDKPSAVPSVENDHWEVSPNGQWRAGFRSGPTVDLYDATRNKIVKTHTGQKGSGDWHLNGTWIKDQFYIYAAHNGSGWLWHVSSDSDQLEGPVAMPGPALVEGGDGGPGLTQMSAAGNRLVVYETFGGTMDRRQSCAALCGVPGSLTRWPAVNRDPRSSVLFLAAHS